MYQFFWKNSNCTRFSVPGQQKHVSGFLPGWEIVPGRKVPGFEIFYFLAGWTLKFSAFGFRSPLLSLYTTPRLDLYVHFTFYIPCSMYQVSDCTRFSITRFFVFLEMYQVSKYQVFEKSIRFKVPGWRKYQVKSTSTGTFLDNLVKKTYGIADW